MIALLWLLVQTTPPPAVAPAEPPPVEPPQVAAPPADPAWIAPPTPPDAPTPPHAAPAPAAPLCPPCPPCAETRVGAVAAPAGVAPEAARSHAGLNLGLGLGVGLANDSVQQGSAAGPAVALRGGYGLGTGRWVLGLEIRGVSTSLEHGGSYGTTAANLFVQLFQDDRWSYFLGLGGGGVQTRRDGETLRKASGGTFTLGVAREMTRLGARFPLSLDVHVTFLGAKDDATKEKANASNVSALMLLQWW